MDIKGVIKAHDYSLKEVAEKMGITKGGLSQIVNGTPNVRTLRTIAEIIGCKVGDFFTDEMTDKQKTAPILKCPHCGKDFFISINVHL